MSQTPHVPPSPPPPPPGGSYTPPPPSPTGGSQDTVMLVLAYIWFFSIIPLVVKKDDREVQWHAKNGLVLAIAYSVIELAFWGIGHFFPVVGCLTLWIPCLIFIGYLVLMVMGIVKATSGQRLRVPMLSDYADKM